MKLYLLFVLGVVMLFGSMWGCAYLVGLLEPGHWAYWPSVFTALITGVGGYFIAWLTGFAIKDRNS